MGSIPIEAASLVTILYKPFQAEGLVFLLAFKLRHYRFRTQLDKLSLMRRKKRWRDDKALVKFLAEL
jgi:hypothetical protein